MVRHVIARAISEVKAGSENSGIGEYSKKSTHPELLKEYGFVEIADATALYEPTVTPPFAGGIVLYDPVELEYVVKFAIDGPFPGTPHPGPTQI
jgi:hypothetical protein